MELVITFIRILFLCVLFASGIWNGLPLVGVAWIGMELFTSRAVGEAMAVTIWGASSSWTLTALPLFLWMGKILFRTRLSGYMFKGLAPWFELLPSRLLHTNVIGCTMFAALFGSFAATCATIGEMTPPELKKRGNPEGITIGTLAGAGALGLMIPPLIIMVVYEVTANVSISKVFIAGVLPGMLLAGLLVGCIVVWALLTLGKIPDDTGKLSFARKICKSFSLIPVVALIALVLGSICTGIATATPALLHDRADGVLRCP